MTNIYVDVYFLIKIIFRSIRFYPTKNLKEYTLQKMSNNVK